MEENTLKSPLRTSLVAGVIVLGLASLLVHPFGAVKGPTSTNLLLAGAVVDSETVQIVERSCQNCHSEKTDWPWYSYVAPVSWLVENDVHKARSHMNLSGWDQYSRAEKQYHLAELAGAGRCRLPDIHSCIATQGFPSRNWNGSSVGTGRAPPVEVIGCWSSHCSRWSSESVKNCNGSLERSCYQRP